MHHVLRTEVQVEAEPSVVWQVPTDFNGYQRWNPFITELEGAAEVGARLVARFEPPGGRAATLRPRITVVESGHILEWFGHVGVPGLLDGRHRFTLHATSQGTRVVQTERFSGGLVRFVRKSIEAGTKAGFEAMDRALKARAEAVRIG